MTSIICGISREQVAEIAAGSRTVTEISRKLGVDRSGLYRALKRKGCADLLRLRKGKSCPQIPRETVLEMAGMLITDAAAELGCHRDTFARAASFYGLRGMFPPNGGGARWMAKRGYTQTSLQQCDECPVPETVSDCYRHCYRLFPNRQP